MHEPRVSVGPRKDRPGKWLVVVRREDERSTATFSSEAEAVSYAEETKAEFAKNPVVAPTGWTVEDLFENFLDWVAKNPSPRSRGAELAPSTLRVYRMHLLDVALPFLGEARKASSITKADIEALLAARRDARSSPSTRFALWDRLRAAFEYGVRQGKLKTNVVNETEVPNVPKKNYEWLRSDEIQPFLSSCPAGFWMIAAVAIFAGLRRRELVYLRRADIDLMNNVIQVRNNPEEGFTTKTGRERSVPIDARLRPFLVAHLKNHVSESPEAWVFPQSNGKRRSDTTRWFAVATQEAAARAGISRKLTFHDLRRTYGAMLIEAGVSLYETSTLLGHSDIRVTQQVYARICGKFLAQSAAKLGHHIGAALERSSPLLPPLPSGCKAVRTHSAPKARKAAPSTKAEQETEFGE